MVGDAAREARITNARMNVAPGNGVFAQQRRLGEMPRSISVLVMAAE